MNSPPVRLDARFTHLVRSGETVVLAGDEDSVLLSLPQATDVLDLVDGRRTAHEIAEALDDVHGAAVVHFVLLALDQEGIVEEAEEEPVGRAVEALDPLCGRLADVLREAWEGRGDAVFVRLEQETAPDLDLIVTDDYLHPAVARIVPTAGREAMLLVRLTPSRVWVGPLLVPGRGPCLTCLQERLRMNLVARALVHAADGDADDIAVRALPTLVPGVVYELAAGAILDLLAGGASLSTAAVRVLDVDGGTSPHPVLRLAHCPTCGDPRKAEPGPDVRLSPRRRLRGGGGYRTVTAEETLARYSNLVSPLTGVVRRLRKVPVDGVGERAHVYTASHALRTGPASVRAVRDDLRDHAGGKGRTDLDARVSALCEALERFSAVHRGTERTARARRSELGDEVISPNELTLFSPAQLEDRDAWNQRQAGHFQLVPEPYADEPIEWSEVRSLVTGDTRRVPSAYLFSAFRGEGTRFCKADSNGLAGGNCIEEAILQGYLELVERDAIAIWWYNRLRRPAVELSDVEDPWVRGVLADHASLGRTLWALDLTTDLRIPCFAALSARTDTVPEETIFGFGAHLDPGIALSRAITEVNQMLPTVLRPDTERRRQLLPEFADAVRWWEAAGLEEHPYLTPDPDRTPVRPNDYAPPATCDLFEDVEHCVGRARAVGCDVLVYDLTRPDVGLPVAKVIAPGFRHFWRRLGPGRLYDVPVALGWLEAPLCERHMNGVSMFV